MTKTKTDWSVIDDKRLAELVEVRKERVDDRQADVFRLEQELADARRSLVEAINLLDAATDEQERRQP